MTVKIPPEFQQFVHQVIDAGSYTSEAAVVGEAFGSCSSASGGWKNSVARFSRRWTGSVEERESSSWTTASWMRFSKTSRLAAMRDWRRNGKRNETLPAPPQCR